jgi:hypothetical protein
VEYERRAARMYLYRWNNSVEKVFNLKGQVETESDTRLQEDSILLDTVIDTQQLLQQTVSSYY